MPSIINGHLTNSRRYTLREVISRAVHLALNPALLSARDVALGAYLVYVAYITYFTLRSIAYLLFEAEGQQRWCPAEPPEEWGPPPPGWRMTWRVCFRLLRPMITRRLGAWVYEVFAWGFFGIVGVFVLEEVVRWWRV